MESKEPTREIVEKAFEKADENGIGKLDINQFKSAIIDLKNGGFDTEWMADEDELKDDFFKDYFRAVDSDGDKLISLEEMLYILGFGDEKPTRKVVMSRFIRGADTDGNGFISAAELRKFALKMELEEEDTVDDAVNMFMIMGDTNGDKKLSVEELINVLNCGPEERQEPKDKMKAMFRTYDTNDDGYINNKEILNLFKVLGFIDEDDTSEEAKMLIKTMVAKYDEDNDGQMNYEEFCKMME